MTSPIRKPKPIKIAPRRPVCSFCGSGNVYHRNIYELVGIELVCKRCGRIGERKKSEAVSLTKRPRWVKR